MFVNYLKALLKAALKILKALLKTILKILFKPFKNIIPVNLKNIELWEANFKNCSLLNCFLRNIIYLKIQTYVWWKEVKYEYTKKQLIHDTR